MFAQTGSAVVLPRSRPAATAVRAEPHPFFWLDGAGHRPPPRRPRSGGHAMTTTAVRPGTARPNLLTLLGRTSLVRITADLPSPHPDSGPSSKGLAAGGMKARAAVSIR
ncbi:hypothetical protein LT493_10080 [Streptomyces tricolor]|nr:hypothetical protein [Streptomyces tricolor]